MCEWSKPSSFSFMCVLFFLWPYIFFFGNFHFLFIYVFFWMFILTLFLWMFFSRRILKLASNVFGTSWCCHLSSGFEFKLFAFAWSFVCFLVCVGNGSCCCHLLSVVGIIIIVVRDCSLVVVARLFLVLCPGLLWVYSAGVLVFVIFFVWLVFYFVFKSIFWKLFSLRMVVMGP